MYIVAALMLLNTGCGDNDSSSSSDDSDTQTSVKLSSIWEEGTLRDCALCHSPQGQEADGVDFSSPSLFVSTLVGKTLADYEDWYVASDCSQTTPFITAGDTQKSTILSAVVKEESDRLQNENGCVSSYNIHKINRVTITKGSALYNNLVEWINAGAKDN